MVDPVLTVVKKLPTANKHYKMIYSKIIKHTPLCFSGPHLPISIFSNRQPNDQISTPVV